LSNCFVVNRVKSVNLAGSLCRYSPRPWNSGLTLNERFALPFRSCIRGSYDYNTRRSGHNVALNFMH